MKYFFTNFLLILFVVGCSTDKEIKSLTNGQSPLQMYELSKELFASGERDGAIKTLENLQAAYPSSKFAMQAKLDIAYNLFNSDKFDESIDILNDFIKLYPNELVAPYAFYLRGLASEKKSHSILDKFITDHAQRDVSTVVDALNFYVDLIKKFPNSEYSVEAKEKLISLRNTLARHELFVAIFYTKKEAYIASINRCKFIIVKYPESPSVPAALHLMAYNYDKIDSPKLAMDARRVLSSSYPKYTPHYSLEN